MDSISDRENIMQWWISSGIKTFIRISFVADVMCLGQQHILERVHRLYIEFQELDTGVSNLRDFAYGVIP